MKRITAIALFALATLVAGTAGAQDHAVKANVPFDFTVGNAHVPAGIYTISSTGSQSIIELRNESGKVNIFGSGYADGKSSETSKLVFDKWGNQYFLREVVCAHGDMSLELPVSKTEKRVQLLQASNQQNKDEVEVALNEIR
ncbi:MAG: hypothetical protein JOY95_08820 [Silvibacterium sp.]|nr:hypothetical protein [Silvibacterium sp.]